MKKRVDVTRSIQQLREFIETRNYAGWDPYDALNSPVARLLSFGRKYGRIGWIQLFRRLPVNLRPWFLASPGHNPKGIGLFLWGYAKLYKSDPRRVYREKVGYLLTLLQRMRSTGYSGACWGYNFDWQSRAFYIPKFTPTVVNSAFIGHALLDAFEIMGLWEARDLALSIGDFMLCDLHRQRDGTSFCFSYTPLDHTTVHNANLLGASLLIRLYKITGDPRSHEAAHASLAYSMNRQRPDGSWFYADTTIQRWIDSFHTGFNLECIKYFLDLGEATQYREAFERGVDFYATRFFLPDGAPKYYHNRLYPIDIHAPAQAVVFFSKMGASHRALTDRILRWMLDNLKDASGYYYFRKGQFITNRIPYMRWSQAWAFHALTEYNAKLSNQQS